MSRHRNSGNSISASDAEWDRHLAGNEPEDDEPETSFVLPPPAQLPLILRRCAAFEARLVAIQKSMSPAYAP